MITILWIILVLLIVFILFLTFFLREEEQLIMPILIISLLLIPISLVLRDEYSTKVSHSIHDAYNMGYKDGQVQCIIGNIEYELRTNEDLSTNWERIN